MKKTYTQRVVFTLLILAGCCPAFAARADDAGARQLFELVNRERAKAGRAALEWDDRLADAARQHAELMADKKMLSHQFSGEPSLRLRLAKTSLRLDRSGENVAYDTGVEQANQGLMASPPHRANILSPDYNAVGIAIVERGEYLYVVEDFAHRLAEKNVSQIEDEISDAFQVQRRNAGASRLPRSPGEKLRGIACSMAQSDEVDARSNEVLGARHIVTFTIMDPRQLPPEVLRLAGNRELSSFALGVCFERSPTYPSGVYWGVMAFFSRSRSSD